MAIKRTQLDSGTYFCTFTCIQWLSLIEITNLHDNIYQWFDLLAKAGHQITGFVIMPNHLHLLLNAKILIVHFVLFIIQLNYLNLEHFFIKNEYIIPKMFHFFYSLYSWYEIRYREGKSWENAFIWGIPWYPDDCCNLPVDHKEERSLF